MINENLAVHTNTDRSLMLDPNIKSMEDLFKVAVGLLQAQGLKVTCVDSFKSDSDFGKVAGQLMDLFVHVRTANAIDCDKINKFFNGITDSENLPMNFWTERYDTLVVILRKYEESDGAMDQSAQKVNTILNVLNKEIDGKASILTTYNHFQMQELGTKSTAYFDSIMGKEIGSVDETFIALANEKLPTMDEVPGKIATTVQGLKGLNCSLEDFVMQANSGGNLPRALNFDLIMKNSNGHEYGKPSAQIAKFYETQIKGNQNISDTAIFYFLLFLDRYNYEEGGKSGETGVFADVNKSRGGLRYGFTEKLWTEIDNGQIGRSFFSAFATDQANFKNRLKTMAELEKNNFEVVIGMTLLGITDRGQSLQMERPTWITHFFDAGLLHRVFAS